MKNITVTVEDDLYHDARLEAARQKTSVTGLVREHLRSITGRQDANLRKQAAGWKDLWDQVDALPAKKTSIGKLDREALHDRNLFR